jgi:hypothetical protein
MIGFGSSRFALFVGVAAVLLAGCGGSQPPIGEPEPWCAVPPQTIKSSIAFKVETRVYFRRAGLLPSPY